MSVSSTTSIEAVAKLTSSSFKTQDCLCSTCESLQNLKISLSLPPWSLRTVQFINCVQLQSICTCINLSRRRNSVLFMYSLIAELTIFTVNICDLLRLSQLPMLSLLAEEEDRDNRQQTSYPNTYTDPRFCAGRQSSATVVRICARSLRRLGLRPRIGFRGHHCSGCRQRGSRRGAQKTRQSSNSCRFAKTKYRFSFRTITPIESIAAVSTVAAVNNTVSTSYKHRLALAR